MQVVKPLPQPKAKVIPSDLYGNHVSGKCWSEGSHGEYASVTKITVTVNKDVLTSIQLQYIKHGGCGETRVHGEKHGGCGETRVFILDYQKHERLLAVSGFYGPDPSAGCVDIIKSLTFHTNKRKFGPVGKEEGTPFVTLPKVGKEEEQEAAVNCPPPPPPPPSPPAGPIVGFFGRADTAFLYAIGVYYHFPGPCPCPLPQ